MWCDNMENKNENLNEQFNQNPIAIKSMGEDLFLKISFFKRKEALKVIYINSKVYRKVFQKEFDYESAKKDILEKFSVTLDKEQGNLAIGNGFVDRQGDPTDIALNGNEGSGRAFYLYKNCNIKGEKTPFATSPRDDYNNGKYSLDCAIQECLISNVLNSIDGFDNFETLAIIDLNEEYLFPHTTGKLPCGLIIRYYEKDELYRFSHRFINDKPFSREELCNIAKKIGILEGNKFIKRFLHGAWSIGNLSIDANMIDLDTSFFVRGRHPQWSFTDKYITNYFGYEQKGQLMVLDTILKSSLNIDEVNISEIEELIETYRKRTIRESFVYLIGYDSNLYEKYSNYFNWLADEFTFLAQIIYDNYDNLNCIDPNCDNTYLFDFSKFFRYYEIAKQSGKWSNQRGLNILLNKHSKSVEYSYDIEEYHEKIKSFFSDIIIDDSEKYFELIKRALEFIDKFNVINDYITATENVDKSKKLVQSYIENEDKQYLMARKWMRAELIDLYKEKGEKYVNDIINIIIEFYSQKDYSLTEFYCDLIIYKEGILFREISVNGYNRICFKSFDDIPINNIILHAGGKQLRLMKESSNVYYSNTLINSSIIELNEMYLNTNNPEIKFNEMGRDLKVEIKGEPIVKDSFI